MRRVAALSSAALLAGCTVAGPIYRLPDSAVARAPGAQAPFVSGNDAAYSLEPLPDHWWQLYSDPQLNALVDEALGRNADLRVAEANLAQAGALVQEAEAGRTVTTTISGGGSLSRPESTGISLPGVVGYDIGISAAYPLDLAGRIRRGIEAARANAEAAAAARDYVRVAVAAGVTRTYLDACSANARLAAVDRVLRLQRQTLDVTRRLQRGGRGTAFDVTRAQAAVDASLSQRPTIVADRQAALFALAALLGRPAGTYPRAVEACAIPPAIDRPLPIGDGAALLRRRPDLREAERRLAAATAQIGVETAALYPQVSLGGSVGLTGPLGDLGSGDAFRLNLGPLISWSFPNRAVARARIAGAEAGVGAALAAFDSAVLAALRDTETNLSRYARQREQVTDLVRARDTAAQAEAQAAKLYHYGRADFLQLLDAQRSLADSEQALANARAAMLDRQVDVFLSLGGGWH
ncbi:MAG TPA: TolC family protein [Sphingomonas sp.]|nr:TolC family protein [Sphingomonas sp.]